MLIKFIYKRFNGVIKLLNFYFFKKYFLLINCFYNLNTKKYFL